MTHICSKQESEDLINAIASRQWELKRFPGMAEGTDEWRLDWQRRIDAEWMRLEALKHMITSCFEVAIVDY